MSRLTRLALLLLIVVGAVVLVRRIGSSSTARSAIAWQTEGVLKISPNRTVPSAQTSESRRPDREYGATASENPAFQSEVNRRLSWYAGLLSSYAAQGKDVTKLRAALTTRLSAIADFVAAARAQGFDERRGNLSFKYVELKRAAYERFDADLRATIGDADFQELQHYEEKLPERTVAAELARRLDGLSDPIDAAVQDRVAELLFVSREPNGERKEVGHVAIGGSDLPPFGERIIPASVFDRLGGTLTNQQLSVLRKMYEEQQRRGHFANPRS